MKKELVSDKQVVSMIVLFIAGSTLMFDAGQGAREDIWLAIILAFIGGLLISLVYGRILTLFPGKNLFQICMVVFGRWIGSVLCFLYAFFGFFLATLVLFDYAEFMTIAGLSDTPKIISMISLMLLVLWIMKEGIITLGRWCEFFVAFILIVILFKIPLFIPILDVDNLRPFLYNGVSPVLGAAKDTFTFPFAETVTFMCIFGEFKNEKSPYSIYRKGLFIGFGVVFVTSVMHALAIGPDEMLRAYFPPYKAFRLISYWHVVTRLEIVIAVGFVIGGFVKITVCLTVCCKGISEITSLKNYKLLVVPIGILCIVITYSNFPGIIELKEWTLAVWSSWAVSFEVFMPVIILIASEIKVRRDRKKKIRGVCV